MPPASPIYQPYTADPAPDLPPIAPSVSTVCPVCGAPVIPGEAFCDNCGSALLGNTAVGVPAAPPPVSGGSYAPPPVSGGSYAPPVSYAPEPVLAPPPPVVTPPPPVAIPQVSPRLIVSSTRAEIPLPNRSELIVGREDPQSNNYPDVDLNPHGALELGVSRKHALITQSGNQYYIEDLNSVNGTLLNQRRIPPRTRMPLNPGDQVMLGRLGLIFEDQ